MFRIIPCKGSIVALAALLCFGVVAAAETAQTEFQRRFGEEIRKLTRHYNDVRKELEEEYAAIVTDKNENCNAIHDRIKELNKKRAAMQKEAAREMGKAREDLARANGIEGDAIAAAREILPANPQKNINDAYEQSMASMRRLYQLNDKRFAELLKIHDMRESLEEARHREERDMAARRVRTAMRLDGSGDASHEKRELEVEAKRLDDLAREREARYQAVLAALDEYRDAVQKRIGAQKNSMVEQDRIMREIAGVVPAFEEADALGAPVDAIGTLAIPERKIGFAQELAELDARKNAEERRYQNEIRFIQEKLAFQQRRNRELSRLNAELHDVEQTWAEKRTAHDLAVRNIDAALADTAIAESEKTTLKSQLQKLKERLAADKKAYGEAVDNVKQRLELSEKALADRMSYLKRRSELRGRLVAASASPTADAMDAFRQEMAKLEERRIDAEREARDEISGLAAAMPTAFRAPPWVGSDIESRRARWNARFDRMRETLETDMENEKTKYQNEILELERRLTEGDLGEEERRQIENVIQTKKNESAAISRDYETTLSNLQERRKMEGRRLAGRARYIAERNRLSDRMHSSAGEGVGAIIEKRIRELDDKWERRESQYRRNMTAQPAETTGDAVTTVRAVISVADAGAGNAAVATDATKRTGTAERRDPGFAEDVEAAYDAVKNAVVDSYHDAVHYLTD